MLIWLGKNIYASKSLFWILGVLNTCYDRLIIYGYKVSLLCFLIELWFEHLFSNYWWRTYHFLLLISICLHYLSSTLLFIFTILFNLWYPLFCSTYVFHILVFSISFKFIGSRNSFFHIPMKVYWYILKSYDVLSIFWPCVSSYWLWIRVIVITLKLKAFHIWTFECQLNILKFSCVICSPAFYFHLLTSITQYSIVLCLRYCYLYTLCFLFLFYEGIKRFLFITTASQNLTQALVWNIGGFIWCV